MQSTIKPLAAFVLAALAGTAAANEGPFSQFINYGDSLSDAGNFPDVGSPLLGRTTGSPDVVLVAAASLDEPARFWPQRVVFHASAQPWDHIDPDLPVS